MCVRTMFAPETNCPAALAVLSDRVAARSSDGDSPAVWDRPPWSKCHHPLLWRSRASSHTDCHREDEGMGKGVIRASPRRG